MLKTATAANKSRGKTFWIRYHGNVYLNRSLIGQKNQTASTAHWLVPLISSEDQYKTRFFQTTQSPGSWQVRGAKNRTRPLNQRDKTNEGAITWDLFQSGKGQGHTKERYTPLTSGKYVFVFKSNLTSHLTFLLPPLVLPVLCIVTVIPFAPTQRTPVLF